MPRPHLASVVEDAWNRRLSGRLRERGWRTRIIPHTGYGSPVFIRILGRAVMSRESAIEARAQRALSGPQIRELDRERRGWRAFVTAPAMEVPVTITFGDRVLHTQTDRSGLVDVTVRGHGLAPGWHTVTLAAPDAADVQADVLVVGTRETFGIISDIDDTVLTTSLPRPAIAAWNTFIRAEGTRSAVPGMATLYRELRAVNPAVPVFYVSTGAWNTAPLLTRFLRRNGYPPGPMLLTDWGPTNSGWFRSGQEHKRASLHRLARDFPQISWLLVGDDGQHDPKIYAEFAAAKPQAVRAIALRELSTSQQVLSHGLPVANDQLIPAPTESLSVPVVRAPDGYGLRDRLRPILAGLTTRHTLHAGHSRDGLPDE